jgi:hypothetical protein
MTIIFGSEAAKQQLAIGRRMCKLEEQQLLITRFFEIAYDLEQPGQEIAEMVKDAIERYDGAGVFFFLMEMAKRAIEDNAMPKEYYELIHFRNRIMLAINGVKQDEPHLFQEQ